MKTFNKATKQKYIERAKQHREADEIVQGLYWKDDKGCCVGCLAHENNNAHKALEKQTGIPEWLSRVADTLHEGLSDGEYQKWPEQFIEAIPVNAKERDLELKVKAPFIVFVLESTLETFDHEKFPDVKKAIDGSITLWQRDDINSDDWVAARTAASAAASDAASAAASAAARTAAWAAARAAWTAASDAASAAWAAASAAWAAASDAAYIKFRNELVRLLRGL